MMTVTGPLSPQPAGEFNEARTLYLERTPKRVRALVDGTAVADSRRAFLLQESGLQPIYYFPPEDVLSDVLSPTDKHTRCPKKGEASYYSITVGERVVENAAWCYAEPIAGAPSALRGLIAFYWDRVDTWLEEDEEVIGHARDPYHRIDVLRTSRHIKVSLDGQVLAETTRAVALFESNLPTRWYIPREDVVAELEPSDGHSICPYKGRASYHSVRLDGGRLLEDLVWYYPEPFAEASGISGLLCFYNEKVDVELDGELQERPESPWHRPLAAAAA